MQELDKQSDIQVTLFGDAYIADSKTPTETDVLNIYKDLSKLTDIERHLNLLYRPFACFINTKCHYNLMNLSLCIPGCTYDPDRHMALVTTHRRPIATIKIYANGNIYCQAFNRINAYQVLSNFSEALAELSGYSPCLRQPKFNLVNATFCMPFPLDLQALNRRYERSTVYTPKKYPFLTYRMKDSMIKFAIFPVGYVYVMFSTYPEQTRRAIAHVLRVLYTCRAPNQQNQSDLELSHGDINFKLLWEKEFQRDDDFSIQWKATCR
nr:TATA-box-binding protein 2 [Drosophila kikkawai]